MKRMRDRSSLCRALRAGLAAGMLWLGGCGEKTAPPPTGAPAANAPRAVRPAPAESNLAAPAGAAPANPAAADAARVAVSRELVNQLAAGQFAQATGHFDATMKAALPAAKLQQVWQGLVAKAGPFQGLGAVRTQELPGSIHVVRVGCRFARVPLDAVVAFNDAGNVAGLHFVPPSGAPPGR